MGTVESTIGWHRGSTCAIRTDILSLAQWDNAYVNGLAEVQVKFVPGTNTGKLVTHWDSLAEYEAYVTSNPNLLYLDVDNSSVEYTTAGPSLVLENPCV